MFDDVYILYRPKIQRMQDVLCEKWIDIAELIILTCDIMWLLTGCKPSPINPDMTSSYGHPGWTDSSTPSHTGRVHQIDLSQLQSILGWFFPIYGEKTCGYVWKWGPNPQWNSHLAGIMISKTIGFFGLHNIFRQTHVPDHQAVYHVGFLHHWQILFHTIVIVMKNLRSWPIIYVDFYPLETASFLKGRVVLPSGNLT